MAREASIPPASAGEGAVIDLDPARLPRHVAIIMDGNGRWAQRQNRPRAAGHRAGVENLRQIVQVVAELKIPVLTVFAFSTENWGRPREEVEFLLHLLDEVLEQEAEELHEHGVRIRVLGSREGLPEATLQAIELVEERTAANTALQLNVAWNYGGRFEICRAAQRIAERVLAGELKPEEIDEGVFAQHLQTAGLPDPDLLIRTGGEFRISNFLLWQLAYAELWITPVYWPDFNGVHFRQAIADYQRRERRFGGLV